MGGGGKGVTCRWHGCPAPSRHEQQANAKPAVAADGNEDDDEPEMEVWAGSLWEVMPEWAAFFAENREALAADGITVPDE